MHKRLNFIKTHSRDLVFYRQGIFLFAFFLYLECLYSPTAHSQTSIPDSASFTSQFADTSSVVCAFISEPTTEDMYNFYHIEKGSQIR